MHSFLTYSNDVEAVVIVDVENEFILLECCAKKSFFHTEIQKYDTKCSENLKKRKNQPGIPPA